jgi:hypothetical protein
MFKFIGGMVQGAVSLVLAVVLLVLVCAGLVML